MSVSKSIKLVSLVVVTVFLVAIGVLAVALFGQKDLELSGGTVSTKQHEQAVSEENGSATNNAKTGEVIVDPDIDITDGEVEQVLVTVSHELKDNEHLKVIKTYDNLQLVLAEVDRAGLDLLIHSNDIEAVSGNKVLEVFDALSEGGATEMIESSSANGPDPISTIGGAIDGTPMPYFSDGTYKYAGAAGGSSGYEVAVIDTGVNSSHLALLNKVVAEACFNSSTNGAYVSGVKVESLCPNGDLSSTVAGAGQDCVIDGCGHGTNVAGAIAMGKVTLANSVVTSGVAPASKIIAMKIASEQSYITPSSSSNPCEVDVTSCIILYLSDIYSALDYTITLAQSRDKIAAVNMSLGTGAYATVSACQSTFWATYGTFKTAVDKLKALGIATVVANGNAGNGENQGKIAFPACVEGVVAVGSTSVDGSHMAYYSQNGALTTLLAPGGDGTDGTFGWMWLPKNGTQNIYTGSQGTSFASPVTAGAYAILRSKYPNMSVDKITDLLTTTGTLLADSRSGYDGLQKPLINVSAALAENIDDFSSEIYDITENHIELGAPVSVRTIMHILDTPFGFNFKNGNHETVYQSGATPYATANSLSNASELVENNWTVETLSYPIDTFSPEVYVLEVQASPDGDGNIDVSVEAKGVISVSVDKDELGITSSPNASSNDRVAVTVSTNIANGYTLSLSTSQPSLVCQSNTSATIGALGSAGNLVNDKWGVGLGSISAVPSSWRGLSVLPYVIDSHSSSATSRTSYIYAGVKISYSTQPCDDYQTQIILTIAPVL
ncbi:MAG: S8/S53 family peptidase [Candidatus Nomurabacteria bacterium]|jgi:hypothetical protein|nr:S8/S53 family peptidase [Candidatus Nomurabacteria bacterium]